MSDFQFLQNPLSKKWVILAPRRAKRPDVSKGIEPVCPFCPGREGEEVEVYRVSLSVISNEGERSPGDFSSATRNDKGSDWQVRVIPNKFPFAPIHEIVIHSPDHHKNFDELPLEHVERILQTYRHQYNEHAHKGQVYMFHNRGEAGGESLPHPHSQIAVVPDEVIMEIPRLDSSAMKQLNNETMTVTTEYFSLFCPATSQWPDEVWIAPKERGRAFGEITDRQIKDFAFVLQRTIQIFDLRHGHEFPFNFYIYPGGDWYLRLIPRLKKLGGFEIGTGVFVNTQDPAETIQFIQTHFHTPDEERIKKEHSADYHRTV